VISTKAFTDEEKWDELFYNGNKLAAKKRYEEALAKHEEGLQFARENLGNTSTEVTKSLSNIAKLHTHLKNWDGAIDHYEQAMDVYRPGAAAKDMDACKEILNLLHGIGIVHLNKGDLARSEKTLNQALNEFGKELHEELDKEGWSIPILKMISSVQLKMGKDSAAINNLEKALDMTVELSGGASSASSETGNLALELAQRMADRMMWTRSVKWFETALAVYERKASKSRSGGNSAQLAQLMYSVGSAYSQTGRSKESVEKMRQALDLWESLPEEKKPALGYHYASLAFSMKRAAGDEELTLAQMDEIIELYDKAILMQEQEAMAKAQTDDFLPALGNLGNALMGSALMYINREKGGDYERAAENLKRAAVLWQEQPMYHDQLINVFDTLARVSQILGLPEEHADAFDAAKELRSKPPMINLRGTTLDEPYRLLKRAIKKVEKYDYDPMFITDIMTDLENALYSVTNARSQPETNDDHALMLLERIYYELIVAYAKNGDQEKSTTMQKWSMATFTDEVRERTKDGVLGSYVPGERLSDMEIPEPIAPRIMVKQTPPKEDPPKEDPKQKPPTEEAPKEGPLNDEL